MLLDNPSTKERLLNAPESSGGNLVSSDIRKSCASFHQKIRAKEFLKFPILTWLLRSSGIDLVLNFVLFLG